MMIPTEADKTNDAPYGIDVIDRLPDAVIRIDYDFKVQFCNQAALQFFTASLGSDDLNLAGLLKTLISKSDLRKAEMGGAFKSEVILENKDSISTICSLNILFHSLGRPSYTLLIKDITSSKQTENKLSKKSEELNRFVYRISHDLRGPVASMLGLYNLVSNDISDRVSLKYFELYQSQVERLNNIVLSLVKHSAIENNNDQIEEFTILNIVGQIESGLSIIPQFQQAIIKKNITDTTFLGDRLAIFTILHSLIDNAVKYCSPYRDCRVEISILHTTEELKISVKDNGMGIDEDIQAKVFQMFYRGNTLSQGPGLGLYLFKCATEKLSASFEFNSKIDKGTHFMVTIPFNQSHFFMK